MQEKFTTYYHSTNGTANNQISNETVLEEELIHFFVAANDLENLNLLLNQRPDCVNDRNSLNETALHLATKLQLHAIVKCLLLFEANPNLIDDFGYAPIHIAVGFESENSLTILNLLIAAKAEIDIEAASKATALIFAASKNNIQAAELLLISGAKIDHQNKSNKTATDFAIQNKNNDLLFLLLKWGAKFPIVDKELSFDLKATLKKFQCIRNERISSITLLKASNKGVFPTLLQIVGFFVKYGAVAAKLDIDKTTNDLKEYIKNYVPREVKLEPWSNFYTSMNTAKDENHKKIFRVVQDIQNLFYKTNDVHSNKLLTDALSSIEIEFNKKQSMNITLKMIQQIHTNTFQTLKEELPLKFVK